MSTPETKLASPAGARRTELEFEILGHIKNALRGAIEANVACDRPVRKLAGVRFVTTSLQQYVGRVFASEEHDGYMTELAETHPHLLSRIKRLRDEHDTLRELLQRIVTRMEVLAADDSSAFDALCKELCAFIEKLDHHTHVEIQLLEDAYLQDTGGEGGM